uniref:Uncharacterized protein n=1 Tax=Trieres chinensis TaxID=1514140 RepID=A0A7S1ZQN5_TRICV
MTDATNTPLAVLALGSELQSRSLCETREEALSIAEAVMAASGTNARRVEPAAAAAAVASCVAELAEWYPHLNDEEAEAMVRGSLGIDDEGDVDDDCESDGGGGDVQEGPVDEGDGDGDGDLIGEGECELCERPVKLTRHHLIPKSTWPKMKKTILSAADAIEDGDEERMAVLLRGTDLPVWPGGEVNARSLRAFLGRTCSVCRA